MSQQDQILGALKNGDTLTPIDALNRFGCFRLGARIYDLKQLGHNIDKRMVESDSGSRFAEYRLIATAQ